MSQFTLGLDMGANSIGWALISEKKNTIVSCGVRIFPEGVANFDTGKEISRNEARRLARSARRIKDRRVRRRTILTEALVQAGLFPENKDEQEKLLASDPYELRAHAVQEELAPYQIGRALLHLNQRRGFQSNRKTDKSDSEVKGMLAEISDLSKDMAGQTLGQYLHGKQQAFDHVNRVDNDHVRKRHTRRQMFIDEFDAIWDYQQQHHSDLLTEKTKHGKAGRLSDPVKPRQLDHPDDHLTAYGIFGIMFFQRKMYWPKSMIGLCDLEPKERRCARADRFAQRFRLLQDVNNLRLIDRSVNQERALSDEERTLLLDKLSKARDMSFDQMRKALGFLEGIRFNLEAGKRKKLWGMPVDKILASPKVFGSSWWSHPEAFRNSVVQTIIDKEDDEDALLEHATQDWGLDENHAEALLRESNKFPAGHLHLSRKALKKLLPHMEKGMVFMADDESNSAMHAAGYLRPDQLQKRIFDILPDPKRMNDCPIGDIPNPVVKRSLVELRKLVNAIIREYGKPDSIHVEMTRELRQSHDARKEYNKNIRSREELRGNAASELREHNIQVTRDSINRYLLWQEQNTACIYSGRKIGFSQLYGGEIEIDHILPYSRSLDDSLMNKVVCFTQENRGKDQQTPYEWMAATNPERYDTICQRAEVLPYPKRRKFIQKDVNLDDFIARQLVDTGYISRASAEYLRCLFDKPHRVLGLKGQLTAELRWQWGLGAKNRDDHTHHAVDAIIVALTNRSRLQHLSKIRKSGGTRTTGEVLPEPWEDFRENVEESISRINVSHRVRRKVSGKLHEDSLYGKTDEVGQVTIRKSVLSLSANEIDNIRDPAIRNIIKKRLDKAGVSYGRGQKLTASQWSKTIKGTLGNEDDPLCMPSGMPIKKVRVTKVDNSIQLMRGGKSNQAYVKPGSTHHVCIFEYEDSGKTKRELIATTMLEASNRLKNKMPIINRDHPKRSGSKFIMSLSQGEMVVADIKGEKHLLVFKTSSSISGQMWFDCHSDAGKKKKSFSFMPNTFNAKKVTVDLLGRIRWAND